MIEDNDVQSLKVEFSIEVTLLGIVMESSATHPWNALLQMKVTLSGIVTEVKEAQPENPLLGILRKLDGIVSEVALLHPENARAPRAVNVSGRLMLCSCVQPVNAA